MTDDKQTIDGMKEEERLKIEIPVEEYDEAGKGNAGDGEDVVRQLRDLGRQMGETLRLAWESEEVKKVEKEVREGVHMFAAELDKVVREVREGDAGQRIRAEADEFKEQVQTGDFGRKVAGGLSQALGWLSAELDKLSAQMTPAGKEKSPNDDVSDADKL
ncbi:MAG: hypothetical protein M9928_22285 [Anaerolineae bacterium]|nr:hypothetical protein [Anaerolineae bacterium]MCO5191160.1 hypothetical protein [Anaerolineae bacterium]MCO5194894.1 hypothetical protein [Anaerolineae bacterium]MCO5199246.1 hypothetical protein [Anaerolineae bacterium]MCO5207745.1 hypothetical protein [Anaerolineae bacterium]